MKPREQHGRQAARVRRAGPGRRAANRGGLLRAAPRVPVLDHPGPDQRRTARARRDGFARHLHAGDRRAAREARARFAVHARGPRRPEQPPILRV